MQGVEVFSGVNCSLANTAIGALLEAMVEAGIIAKNYSFQHVLFLTDRVSLHQVFKLRKSTNWLDSSRIADLNFLSQNGLFCNTLVVPHVVVKTVWCFAKQAVNTLLYFRWYHPALCNIVWTLSLFDIKKNLIFHPKKKNIYIYIYITAIPKGIWNRHLVDMTT